MAMNGDERRGIEDAFAMSNGHTSALAMALFGLMNELADRSVIDAGAVDSIEAFTIKSLHRAGVEMDAAQQLERIYRTRFAEIRDNCRPLRGSPP